MTKEAPAGIGLYLAPSGASHLRLILGSRSWLFGLELVTDARYVYDVPRACRSGSILRRKRETATLTTSSFSSATYPHTFCDNVGHPHYYAVVHHEIMQEPQTRWASEAQGFR